MNYLVGHIILCVLLSLTRMDRRNRQNNEDQKDCLHLDSTKQNCGVSIGGAFTVEDARQQDSHKSSAEEFQPI